MNRIVDLIWRILLVLIIIIALFFGARKAVYCLQHTGQLDCAIVVDPSGDKK